MRRAVPILALLTIACAASLEARVQWGVRAGFVTTDTDPVIGAEMVVPIGTWHVAFNPNVEQSFGSPNVLSLNGDFAWQTELAARKRVWIGAGLAEIIEQGSDLAFGGNVFVGVGQGPLYLQSKAVFDDDATRVRIVLGYRF